MFNLSNGNTVTIPKFAKYLYVSFRKIDFNYESVKVYVDNDNKKFVFCKSSCKE